MIILTKRQILTGQENGGQRHNAIKGETGSKNSF